MPTYNVVRCDYLHYLQTSSAGCVLPGYRPTLTMSLTGDAPETAAHIQRAQSKLWNNPGRRNASGTGYPLVRKYWPRNQPNLNRREMRRKCRAMKKSGSCDEYAFASTYQGCYFMTCSVDRIDLEDNKAGGRQLNLLLYRPFRVLDGDAYWVRIVP
ncbi:hypothetical protein G5V59_12890 [Nocardioides sp. W3-2-3]|nr:hypothetical protein [Nocardioides convexus]